MGEGGEQYGYKDGWADNGVFRYTGEGRVGHMEFVRGNRAIQEHATNGRELHLFQALSKDEGYRYLGRFDCLFPYWEDPARLRRLNGFSWCAEAVIAL